MPPVSEPRRRVLVSKSWRERPRRRARGVAPRLSGRVVHATACVSVAVHVVRRTCKQLRTVDDRDLHRDRERLLPADLVHVLESFYRSAFVIGREF